MINPELEEDAKDRLVFFLKNTLSLLHSLVYEPYGADNRPFFAEEHLKTIRDGWEEFIKDFEETDPASRIRDTSGGALQSHGLYGQQLKLKLAVVASWSERFLAARTKKVLLRLLDAIDSVLDSLIKATGIDEALKEMKDILRNSIDEE